MLRHLHAVAAALLLSLPAVVCAQQGPAAAPASGEAAPASGEAARVGDRVITLQEVDEAWRKADPVEHTRATQLLYQGRKQALDRMIADLLIEQAAKSRGVAPDQFAAQEIAKRVKPVTEAQVAAFYEQNRARMSGKPLQEMQGLIRDYLEQQQQTSAREAIVAELRKSGPPVRVAIDAPRQRVDVAASDPSRGGAAAPVVIVEFSDYQ